MELKVSGTAEVTIDGDIKSMDDYQEIKKMIKGIVARGARNVTIRISDSVTIPSSVIGYLLKLVRGDGIEIAVEVWSKELYRTLQILKLLDVFKVSQLQ
jgi:anti-anti-sigma regulatory factor